MLFRATILAFAGLASACVQQPTGALGGNPIGQPTLNQIVPVGKPFTITWNPTTPGTVSIVLLRGPSENVIPIDCLAESIPNTGTFTWNPSSSLVADVTHYGIQIIATGTGQYQYSTQFGISNAAGPSSSSSSSSAASITSKAASSSQSGSVSASATSGAPVTQISDGQVQVPTSSASISRPASSISISTRSTNATSTAYTSSTYSSSSSARLTASNSSAHSTSATPTVTLASSIVARNTTILLPTGSITVPISLRTTTTANATAATSARSTATPTPLTANPNAASRAFAAGGMLGMVGIVVVLLM